MLVFSSLFGFVERVKFVVLPSPVKVSTTVSPLPIAALKARTVNISPVCAPLPKTTDVPVLAV